MMNPFDPAYLTTATAVFGPLAWTFLACQAVLLGAGLYFRFGRRGHTIAIPYLDRVLMAAGGIGILLGALRLGDVAVFNQRYWFYILLLVELALAGSAFWSVRRNRAIPEKQRKAGSTKGSQRSAARTMDSRTKSANRERDEASVAVDSLPSHSRRQSRRDRKRKQR